MIGNKYNKQKGQVLLITVMLLATILTVVLSLSFKSTGETQITKLEEESQKALAAAEAGIEAALKQGAIANISSLPGLESFTGSVNIETTKNNAFISPLLQKDEQYTFYLSQPGSNAPEQTDFTNLISQYNNNALTVCSTSNSIALELTLIKAGSSPSTKRFSINPPTTTIIQNAEDANQLGACPSGENFSYKHQLSAEDIGSNNLILIVRIINGTGKVGFTAPSGINLPLQGKSIISEAKSKTGVNKKVSLFQSYPQIPSDFFVTSF
ncbi:MAG: hypothetical protein NC935_07545 [Candidatus Omnitrophica bacterium]|nr:hypothetical protein [Candidatus Omnitrophota bacterium]